MHIMYIFKEHIVFFNLTPKSLFDLTFWQSYSDHVSTLWKLLIRVKHRKLVNLLDGMQIS